MKPRDGRFVLHAQVPEGPWSSSCSFYHSVVAAPHCVDVAYKKADHGRFDGGWGAYLSVEAMNEALARCVHPGIQLHAYRGQTEIQLSDEVCKTSPDGTFTHCFENPDDGKGLIYRLRKADAALVSSVRQ